MAHFPLYTQKHLKEYQQAANSLQKHRQSHTKSTRHQFYCHRKYLIYTRVDCAHQKIVESKMKPSFQSNCLWHDNEIVSILDTCQIVETTVQCRGDRTASRLLFPRSITEYKREKQDISRKRKSIHHAFYTNPKIIINHPSPKINSLKAGIDKNR